MTRREVIAGSACLAGAAVNWPAFCEVLKDPSDAKAVRITIDTRRALGMIPSDFIGLGYEISSVSRRGLLSANNRIYTQLVRTLGASGVIRIGGNTSDYATFTFEGKAVSEPKATVVNQSNLRDLGTFLNATGWKLIWGLNLGRGSEQEAIEEAQAVLAATGEKLLAFEIGNEPDLFGRGAAHRPKSYSYEDYLSEYRRYKAAIRDKLPNAPFAGPDVAGATVWVTRFATDEGNDLKLLTHHYYRECANPTSSLDKLLHPDPKLAPELEQLRSASLSSRVPYRICETNSFCGGGKTGVSDTFGSALWVLDYMFTLASADAAGVNIETGVNQLGFISSYSPIGDDEHGAYSAVPEYYGMLAFAQASRGQWLNADCNTAALNLTAYALLSSRNRISLVVINKDQSRNADVTIAANEHFFQAELLRLTAPSLDSKEGVMLGGSTVVADGNWKPSLVETLPVKRGACEVRVPAASAAIITAKG